MTTFLAFLHKMQNWQATNGDVHCPLKELTLSCFMMSIRCGVD